MGPFPRDICFFVKTLPGLFLASAQVQNLLIPAFAQTEKFKIAFCYKSGLMNECNLLSLKT